MFEEDDPYRDEAAPEGRMHDAVDPWGGRPLGMVWAQDSGTHRNPGQQAAAKKVTQAGLRPFLGRNDSLIATQQPHDLVVKPRVRIIKSIEYFTDRDVALSDFPSLGTGDENM